MEKWLVVTNLDILGKSSQVQGFFGSHLEKVRLNCLLKERPVHLIVWSELETCEVLWLRGIDNLYKVWKL